jgi:opacity protein-like surface antigen
MTMGHMKKLHLTAAVLCVISAAATAQTNPSPNPVATRRGWEVGGQVARYSYEEPDAFVKLTGNRVGGVGAYTFTDARGLFSRFDLRLSYGSLRYEGSGTQDYVPDTILEGRAVAGRDFFPSDSVSLSPFIGLGYRYLYDDLQGYTSTGASGYRRYSNYLYAPVGLTMRFRAADRWVVAPTIEYDWFIRGRQESKLSDAGPVDLGDGVARVYPDISNTQRHGRGYRASLMFEKDHWTFGPWMHYWNIKESDPVVVTTSTLIIRFTEPANWTREYGVELRYRF